MSAAAKSRFTSNADNAPSDPRAISLPCWEKKGQIFTREGGIFFQSHATRPIPYLIDDNILRIFFFSRCVNDMMHPTFIDVDAENPARILDISEQPIMPLGVAGTFDDSGVSPGSLLQEGSRTVVYYTGWKRRRHVSFELSIGIAELIEDGRRMKRLFEGPLIGQDRSHPILAGGPFVRREHKRLRMWYCSGLRWIMTSHGPEPIYSVFHAESSNGIDWRPTGGPVLKEAHDNEVITAPWVVRHAGGWLMWYSYRGSASPAEKRYRIGVAASTDGEHWVRRDEEAGLECSVQGWDADMACYPSFYTHRGRTIMLYSGNHVGRGGIGWAVASEPFQDEGDGA